MYIGCKMNKEIYNQWYFNENRKLREYILWEIFKDTGAKRHSTDFILAGKDIVLPHRFYTIGSFRYMVGQIMERFVKSELEPSYHYFRSVARLRFVDNDEPVDLKDKFKQQIFGFDLVFDIDNKPFKKWWLEHENLESPLILAKVDEYVDDVKKEAEIIKNRLDKHNVPYIINFSGSGFRLCIEWDEIKDYFKVEDFGARSTSFINWVKEGCKHDFQYFGEIGSGYCLTRALYSLHPITKLVALPLSDGDFDNFSLEMVKPLNLLGCIAPEPSNKPRSMKREGSFAKIYEKFAEDEVK